MEIKDCKQKIGKNLYKELKKDGLSLKEIKFVAEYLTNGHNGTQAYLTVIAKKGTSTNTANVECHRYLRKPSVQRAIKKVFEIWLGEKKEKLEKEIVEVLRRRAFYDITLFQDELGNWKKLDEIDKEWLCVVDGTEVKYYGKDAKKKVIILKLANKDNALDKLAKYIQMTKETKDINLHMSKDVEKKMKDIFEKSRAKSNIEE